jgi:hypothetical protein
MSSRTDRVLPFSSLPEPVQSQIAKSFRSFLGHKEPNPLLSAGRCGRDAVLGSLTEVAWGYKAECEGPDRSIGPLAGLLHRACNQAPVGLKVQLFASDLSPEDLYAFIHPGVASGGWDRVHHLVSNCCTSISSVWLACAPASCHILSTCMRLLDNCLLTLAGAGHLWIVASTAVLCIPLPARPSH